MKRTSLFMTIVFSVVVFTGCQKKELLTPPANPVAANSNDEHWASILSEYSSGISYKALPRPQSWADCEKFGGVVTPATFNPASGNFDELYMNPNGYADGVPLISESKPGDQDFNGGRWHLNVIKPTVDPGKYSAACTVEDLDMDDFMSTTNYFECPLLPMRGN